MPQPDHDCVISETGRHYLRLHLASEVGPILCRRLMSHFGSITAALGASSAELERVNGIGAATARAFLRTRGAENSLNDIERASEANVRILCLEDPQYPRPLLGIPDAPICLYVRGTLKDTDAIAISIVGTRRCSHYGREQALRFAELLGRAGFTVVSGLARGIDGHSHRGALNAGGRTIAVLGSGVRAIYPREHEALADEITASGAVLSEIGVDTPPDAKNFPRRNRIIAGLSLGVIVVEAGKKSGALITARLANEYNREVFSIPGRVDQPTHTAGSNGLIRDAQAKLITCLDDVLDELHDVGDIMRPAAADQTRTDDTRQTQPSSLSKQEQSIVDILSRGIEDIERIADETSLEPASVLAGLSSLELKGYVRREAGNRFFLRRKANE